MVQLGSFQGGSPARSPQLGKTRSSTGPRSPPVVWCPYFAVVVVPVQLVPMFCMPSVNVMNQAKGFMNNKFARARASQSAAAGRPPGSSSSVASRLSAESKPFVPLASTSPPIPGRRSEGEARFTRVGRRGRGIPASAVVQAPRVSLRAKLPNPSTPPEPATVPSKPPTRTRGFGHFSRTAQREEKGKKTVSFAPDDTAWGPALLHQAKLDRLQLVAHGPPPCDQSAADAMVVPSPAVHRWARLTVLVASVLNLDRCRLDRMGVDRTQRSWPHAAMDTRMATQRPLTARARRWRYRSVPSN